VDFTFLSMLVMVPPIYLITTVRLSSRSED
jgi:hypothetical protein